MLVETHAHLDFPEYDNDREDVIKRAKAANVGIIINVSSSLRGSLASLELSRRYDCVYAACGIHPHDAKGVTDDVILKLKELALSSKKVVAIGEVGLDFYRNLSARDIQHDAYIRFLKLSKELDLPLILHCREESALKKEASRLILQGLREHLDMPVQGVIHCFSGDSTLLREALEMGLYVSFTCNVTFKKADSLRETLKATPIERLLLETDSPFLAPEQKRGQRNEPAYISYLVDAISENLNIGRDEVERITTENARTLFRL